MLIFFHNMDGLYSNFVTDEVVITYLFKKQNKLDPELTFKPCYSSFVCAHVHVHALMMQKLCILVMRNAIL